MLFGEADRAISLSSGMPAFENITFTTTYSDVDSVNDGYAPEWATHIVLTMNLYNVPSGVEIFIDDLAAYAL